MSNLRVPDLNKVFIAGRLTRDPVLAYTTAGKPYCKFSIANTRYYKAGDERREDTSFVDVTAWGPQAEFIGQRLQKGRPVLIEGSLKSSEWEKDGQKRTRLEINAQRVTPLDWDEDQGRAGNAAHGASQEETEPLPEDDIPF